MRFLYQVIIILLLISCDKIIEMPERKIENYVIVKSPTFFYNNNSILKKGDNITISSPTLQSSIFFTIDGTNPDINNYYSAGTTPVKYVILSDVTIKAVAYKNGYYSDIVTASYTVK